MTEGKIARRSTRSAAKSEGKVGQGMLRQPGQRQGVCSQPQPISMTCDFSASLQYSLQNLLPSSGGQSQAPWAHELVVSSAMRANLLLKLLNPSVVWGCRELMLRPHRHERQGGAYFNK